MKKTTILTLTLLLLVPTIFALTLEGYVTNLDTSYYDGTINITLFQDRITDTDSNSLNDTLIFNLTTDYATNANLTANVFFVDENVPSLSQTKEISSSVPSFLINISTYYLTEPKYTYFVRIYNQIGQIVYESSKINTSSYLSYETGTNITQITDQNINNDFIRINLSLNVIRNETVNITVNLGYNKSIISSTKEYTITTPNQIISLDFDNETIKSTHYKGNYSIENIQIGDKNIDFDYNTSYYDYEDFAKTSYIKDILSYQIDNNSNNLSDALRFNFTLDIESTDDYSLDAEIYDDEDNFIADLSKNVTLSTGNNIVSMEIPGEDLYSTYYDGELTLSYAKLSIGNSTQDVIFNPHTTNITYYSEFEKPPLADLNLDIITVFYNNTANVSVNISNLGEVPAFNVFTDIFDNSTYENRSSISFLDVGESHILNYIIENSTNESVITAIADFSNLVDESNESNNIAQYAKERIVSLGIDSINELYSENTQKIFEFVIRNDGDYTVENISLIIDMGDNTTITSENNISSLSTGEYALVYVRYNYSTEGQYLVTANATGISTEGQISALNSINIDMNDLNITLLDSLSLEATTAVIEFSIKNNKEYGNLENINWSLDFDDGTIIYAKKLSNLTNNESLLVYSRHNYTSAGTYTIRVIAGNFEKTQIIEIKEIEVSQLELLNLNQRLAIFGFRITNILDTNLTNVSFSFDTKDGLIRTSNENMFLGPGESVFAYMKHNFSSAGSYNVNATAYNGTLMHSRNYTLNID